MSSESLEEGEIASEAEPTPEPSSPAELNDESVIDEIVKNERRADTLFSPSFEQPQQSMVTSWHANGNGNNCNNGNGVRETRQPPPESVIFGMSTTTAPVQQPNQDIRLLQNLINTSYDFYPPPGINRGPLHYFPAPPALPNNFEFIRPLMSLSLPPHPPMIPTSSQQNLQPISPTPLPQSFDDNYEQICMDIVSPDDPQTSNGQPTNPPIEIPLEAVVDAPKPAPKPVLEDEEALRAMLLSQLSQKKKRNAEKPTTKSSPKRLRKNSARISTSAENAFGTHAPIQPPPPIPKIEVRLTRKTVEEPAAPVGLNAETSQSPESPESPPPSPARELTESLTREARKAQLELRMFEINKTFEEQRAKVANASKEAKTAADMAKRAAEMAKEAEEMNKKALEMREKCKEDSRIGKENMKKILIEKRDIQNAIDIMSIEDLDDIDVEDFPAIIVSEVKREPTRSDSDYRSPKHEPMLTAESSVVDQNSAESSFREPETSQELMQNGVSDEKEDEEVMEKEIEEEAEKESNEEIDNRTEDKDEEESIEGEDEYEEVEEEEMSDPISPEHSTVTLTEIVENGSVNVETENVDEPKNNNTVTTGSTAMEREAALRQRLMNKMTRPEKLPEDLVPVVSSSIPDHATECRNMLLKMCKFELNGKCERPRDCPFLHLHSLTDRKQQMQLLEGLFREIFEYNEEDIEVAVQQTLHFMPEFTEFEKLMEKFASVVYQNTPSYKNKLFTFFANRR
ncbi:hypothetical protein CAEBREN_25630 [Caenorhabditis brenneri]|uniref:C3H1-type domain-containing protein n=1 Tax=Caenorhabditis brenneri TaxID=135651 RepID=G0P853_CAEBE|nr:hypothetical protein CAEBREN_25630 [Caenorhabditis brenneri]